MGLPRGYHFYPTDQQLLSYYLTQRVTNGRSFSGPYPKIPEVDVYRDHPARTFWSQGEAQSAEEQLKRYFFTTLEKAGKKGRNDKVKKNISRKVGCYGTWKGEHKSPVCARQNGKAVLLGYKSYFAFVKGEDCPKLGDDIDEGCRWFMREYSLPKEESDIVLCCITMKRSKKIHKPVDNGSSVVIIKPEDQENSSQVCDDHEHQERPRNKRRICVGDTVPEYYPRNQPNMVRSYNHQEGEKCAKFEHPSNYQHLLYKNANAMQPGYFRREYNQGGDVYARQQQRAMPDELMRSNTQPRVQPVYNRRGYNVGSNLNGMKQIRSPSDELIWSDIQQGRYEDPNLAYVRKYGLDTNTMTLYVNDNGLKAPRPSNDSSMTLPTSLESSIDYSNVPSPATRM